MPDDNDKLIWRIILGLNLIPGLIRVFLGILGLWLIRKLKVLAILDQPLRRPDWYNEYEIIINIFNFLNLWTPIVSNGLLSFSIIVYFADVSGQDTEYWEPSGVVAADAFFTIWFSVVSFAPGIIDAAVNYYFYVRFKEFIEKEFENFLYACNWKCKSDRDPDVRPLC